MVDVGSFHGDTAPEILQIASAQRNYNVTNRFERLPDYRNEERLSGGVRFYIGDGYAVINAYLNNPMVDLTHSYLKSSDVMRMLAEIMRDMRPLSQDMVSFRGIRLDRDEDVYEGGISVELTTLTSTSVSREVAVGFASGDCIIKLRIPAGTPVIVTNRWEFEIILPPGVRIGLTHQYDNVRFPYVEERTGNPVYAQIRRVLIGEVGMGD